MRRLDMEVGDELCHPYDESVGTITKILPDGYLVRFDDHALWIDGPKVDIVFFSDLEALVDWTMKQEPISFSSAGKTVRVTLEHHGLTDSQYDALYEALAEVVWEKGGEYADLKRQRRTARRSA